MILVLYDKDVAICANDLIQVRISVYLDSEQEHWGRITEELALNSRLITPYVLLCESPQFSEIHFLHLQIGQLTHEMKVLRRK